MGELGWTPMKARGLSQTGFKDQVRGYAREARTLPYKSYHHHIGYSVSNSRPYHLLDAR